MRNCWAETLADCEGPLSEEHYLSHGIIGSVDDVIVSGLPFLRGETRAIPGAKLTRNMLCKSHNERLSPVDGAAKRFFEVIKAFKQRAFMRAHGGRKRGGIDTYTVDGALVERWGLKTLVNVMFDREIATGARWRPDEQWVRCAFGIISFPDWCGLYLGTGEFDWKERDESTIGIRLLTDPNDATRLIAGVFGWKIFSLPLRWFRSTKDSDHRTDLNA